MSSPEYIEKYQIENLAVVTHSGVIRAWLSYLLSEEFKGKLNSCSVTLLKYNNQWEISYINYSNHLTDLKNMLINKDILIKDMEI